MAVLVEGVCLLLRCDAVREHYPGGVTALAAECPAVLVCADDDLMALTFDDSDTAEDYLAELEAYGLRYLVDDMAADAVLADPHIGPVSPCGWAEYTQVAVGGDGGQRVAACAFPGSELDRLRVPVGWTFVGSRSERLSLAEDRPLEPT